MSRVGQVWMLDGSIELIVARIKKDRYLTLVLWSEHHTHLHDHVDEKPLRHAESDELMTRYQRLA